MTGVQLQRAVLLAQAGDQDAMRDVLVATAELAGPLLRRISATAAEDVLQDVLWTVARRLRWLDQPIAFRAWVYRIASRAMLNTWHGNVAVWPLSPPEDMESLPAGAKDPDPPRVEEIPHLLEAATPRSRAVLVLHYLEELSLEEVAAVLDLPLGTVKSRLAYGLQLMRREASGKADHE